MLTWRLWVTFLAIAGWMLEASPPRLFEWERGIGLQAHGRPELTLYLWFYEWNMFGAVEPGEHTHGTYRNSRKVAPDGRRAIVTAPGIRFEMTAVEDGANLTLTVENLSGHDWPDLAGIIPCWSPGQAPGTDPNSPAPLNPNFADPEHRKTWFVSAHGLDLLAAREIHFNRKLRPAVDRKSPEGKFAFSYKWPMSQVDSEAGLLVREAADGRWVTGIGWEDFLSTQGHNPWSCMHACVRVGPLKSGQIRQIQGRIYLFEGTAAECLNRFQRGFGRAQRPAPETDGRPSADRPR
jgi:hypothetical protein